MLYFVRFNQGMPGRRCLKVIKWVEEPVTWTPPPLEPIVPVSGNRLKTQRFAWFWTADNQAILESFVFVCG